MSASPAGIFSGEGVARATARAVDWSKTPVGPTETWPTSLLTTLRILLNSRHPMFLWWGPELVQFYNDAYLPSFGQGKHPAAMGQRGADCWQEIWPIIYPQIADVLERGQASWNENQLVPIFRNGRIEEVFWTYGYSPVLDESGEIHGVLVVCTETTTGVLAARRLDVISKLATALNDAESSADVARLTSQCLADAPHDVPYSIVKLEGSGKRAVTDPAKPRQLEQPVPGPLWPEPVTEEITYPFDGLGGTLTFGLSPRLPFDEGYRRFLQQIAETLASAQSRIEVGLERRRLLLQAPVAAALLTGPEHVFEIANPRYVNMVQRDLLGKSYLEAFPELRDTALPGILDRVYSRGEPYTSHEMLIPLVHEDSGLVEERFFNFSLEPVQDVRGRVYGMMAVAIDITSQVKARAAVERSHEERSQLLNAVQVASRAKDEFLAMLGHELRNPLAPILTALELMKVKGASGVEHERAIIERQARHLVHLVDDLLDTARIAEGKVQLKKRRIALAEVVANAIETANPLLEEHRHRLRVDVPAVGLDVHADPSRVAQIVSNLLTNAARYTKPGGAISIRGWNDDRHALLRVEDNGVGISAEQLPRLFERFFQGTRPSDRVQGGLGLGLALVKSLVELHGGSVRAESAGPGQGSAFELRLPLAQGAPTESAPSSDRSVPPPRPRAERVLLVDDNEDITELFGELLAFYGFEVRTAEDGPSALRIAVEFKPTVAVLDLGLPVMDGYEVAAKLRAMPEPPRIIAMSGYGREDDVERTRRAGFEGHLVKPVDSGALLLAIAPGTTNGSFRKR